MSWQHFHGGASIGQPGSEGGTIVLDESHEAGARITLERGGQHAPFAITCGIDDWMVHTRFLGDEPEARSEFEAIKEGLARLLAALPEAGDPPDGPATRASIRSISGFVERFP